MKINKHTVVAAHGLIKKGDKYLVTKRSENDDYMPGYWDLPGGTLDFGENIQDGLKREVKEETGIEIKVNRVISVCNYLSNPKRYQFTVTYECDYISGRMQLDLNEHDESRWVTIAELKDIKKITFLEQLYKELTETF